jgi:2,3-bisphosphoglycerate-independent phosphoglycerate mutase
MSTEIALTDPLFSEEHRLQAAAIVATAVKKGVSVQAAMAEAERILYERLYSGLSVSQRR